jgi:predicted kinase
MKTPTLYIFSGLPASGKSTLAQELAKGIRATFIRIDTVEQGLRDICNFSVQGGEGYELCHLLASDNLKLGNDVVADSVNPWDLTRKAWNEVATSNRAKFINVEVICSDRNKHRLRVESRVIDVKNLKRPTWEAVLNRDYHRWTDDRILIDTSGKTVSESVNELIEKLAIVLP